MFIGASVTANGAHPRSRGENIPAVGVADGGSGSSPLTRGKLRGFERFLALRRLIPAHAGKTQYPWLRQSRAEAHPRSRGENLIGAVRTLVVTGSSPLTRGKPLVIVDEDGQLRLIPAHAGKTPLLSAGLTARWAHPRSRGENAVVGREWDKGDGSSPLTRGKHGGDRRRRARSRLIPAHAGKTLPDLRFYCADRSDLGNP